MTFGAGEDSAMVATLGGDRGEGLKELKARLRRARRKIQHARCMWRICKKAYSLGESAARQLKARAALAGEPRAENICFASDERRAVWASYGSASTTTSTSTSTSTGT
jgi:hypothetical protein